MKRGKVTALVMSMALATVLLTTRTRAEDGSAFHDYGSKMVGGTWVSTDPDGNKQEHMYRWGPGQRFLLFVSNDTEAPTCAIIGINPATGKHTWWVFMSDGGVGLMAATEMKEEPNGSRGAFESADGKTRGKSKMKYLDKDRLEAEIEREIDGVVTRASQLWERKSGEPSLPDVTSDAPAQIPSGLSVLAQLDTNVLIDSQSSLGEKLVGTAVNKWILDGRFWRHSAAFVYDDQRTGSYLSITGVDPETNLVTGWEFDDQGGVGKYVLAEDGKSVKGRYTPATGEAMTYEGDFTMADDGTLMYTAKGKTGDVVKPYYVNYRKLPKLQ